MRYVLLFCFLINITGCTAFMHGYTSAQAQNQILIVDQDAESFGYERVQYIKGYHGKGIEAFFEEKGLPDYLYEFTENDRHGAAFFYIAENRVYVFKEVNWNPSSFSFFGMRELNDTEKQRFGVQEKTKIAI